ncbi:hypothetical protein HAX54_025384, partial [Datura stramonium]|nr:hypothetical protein [Datura stramonium]
MSYEIFSSRGSFDLEEVGYTGDNIPSPLPANVKFNITSTMMQLQNMKGLFNGSS